MTRKRIGLFAWAWPAIAALPAAAQVHESPALFPSGDVPAVMRRTEEVRAEPFIPGAMPEQAQPTAFQVPLRPAAGDVNLASPGARTTPRLPLRSPSADGAAKSPGPGSNLLSVFAALAVVLGLFLIAVWLARRGVSKPGRMLPKEAVEMLGHLPFPGRMQGHLLRVGNKIILAGFSTSGADVLAEITDPVEVDRLAGLCRQDDPYSATGAFRAIIDQFLREKPRGNRDAAAGVATATHAGTAAGEDDDA